MVRVTVECGDGWKLGVVLAIVVGARKRMTGVVCFG